MLFQFFVRRALAKKQKGRFEVNRGIRLNACSLLLFFWRGGVRDACSVLGGNTEIGWELQWYRSVFCEGGYGVQYIPCFLGGGVQDACSVLCSVGLQR